MCTLPLMRPGAATVYLGICKAPSIPPLDSNVHLSGAKSMKRRASGRVAREAHELIIDQSWLFICRMRVAKDGLWQH